MPSSVINSKKMQKEKDLPKLFNNLKTENIISSVPLHVLIE